MIGYRPYPLMKYCWTYITPFICFVRIQSFYWILCHWFVYSMCVAMFLLSVSIYEGKGGSIQWELNADQSQALMLTAVNAHTDSHTHTKDEFIASKNHLAYLLLVRLLKLVWKPIQETPQTRNLSCCHQIHNKHVTKWICNIWTKGLIYIFYLYPPLQWF